MSGDDPIRSPLRLPELAPDADGGSLDLDVRASDSAAGAMRVDSTATLGYRSGGLSLGAMAGLSVVDADFGWFAGCGLRYRW